MTDSFDWNFVGEPESPRPPGQQQPLPGGRRRWLVRGAALVFLLALLGLWGVPWLAERLTTVDKGEAALRAVVEKELEAIREGDAELFRSLQDPIDPTWQERQVARYFSQDAAGFPPAPGFALSGRPDEVQQTRFLGRYGRVELVRWFVGPTTQDVSQTPKPLPFRVTWFYRLGEDGNWTHVGPPSNYVGSPHAFLGIYLEVRANEVEAEQIGLAARQLTVLVSQACRWLGCSGDDEYILGFQDIATPGTRGDLWVLPAPHLTGLPADDQARIAWAHAVERWVIDRLAQAQAGGDEVAQRLIFRQLLASLKSRLGLAPVSAAELSADGVDLLAAAARDQRLDPLGSLWRAAADQYNPEQTRLLEAEVAAFLSFLGDQVGAVRVYQLLPALSRYESLGSALSSLYGLDRHNVNADWLTFLEDLTGQEIATERSGNGTPVGDKVLQPPATP